MSRRIKILHVTNDILVAFFQLDGTKRLKVTGMPADARIVGVDQHRYWDEDRTSFTVRSAEFPEVPENEAIPDLNVELCEVSTAGAEVKIVTPGRKG